MMLQYGNPARHHKGFGAPWSTLIIAAFVIAIPANSLAETCPYMGDDCPQILLGDNCISYSASSKDECTGCYTTWESADNQCVYPNLALQSGFTYLAAYVPVNKFAGGTVGAKIEPPKGVSPLELKLGAEIIKQKKQDEELRLVLGAATERDLNSIALFKELIENKMITVLYKPGKPGSDRKGNFYLVSAAKAKQISRTPIGAFAADFSLDSAGGVAIGLKDADALNAKLAQSNKSILFTYQAGNRKNGDYLVNAAEVTR